MTVNSYNHALIASRVQIVATCACTLIVHRSNLRRTKIVSFPTRHCMWRGTIWAPGMAFQHIHMLMSQLSLSNYACYACFRRAPSRGSPRTVSSYKYTLSLPCENLVLSWADFLMRSFRFASSNWLTFRSRSRSKGRLSTGFSPSSSYSVANKIGIINI